ncbi:ABC transporter substrate-binding protein [Deinococcus marmoris]|uniref:N-Acetyl-D-glucosamine ABC transport system, sugar-binding protein n=1 Tax=Deinococcus marmoris TaxID=249408 RepID=A0A1U7P124_9DEIO|nr:extracellular solute-binding protein [Deinococcus marmoris]OLV18864.1 N-Acetyl-D-glucosamine ABC transport system, sugar-binding protein [Deinococcus marmoris]
MKYALPLSAVMLISLGLTQTTTQAQAVASTITVWTWPDNDKTFETTVKLFNKVHPEITVKVQAFANGNDIYKNKLLTSLISGSGPDVAMVEIGVVSFFRDKPGFVDLSQSPYNAKRFASNYDQAAWADVNTKDGKIFALPKNTGPGALFYRRDLFKAAGIKDDPASISASLKDWDQFIEVGKKVSKDNKQWMISTADEMVNAIVAEAGVSYFNSAGELQVTGPVFQKAFAYAKKAYDAGIISPFSSWTPEWQATMSKGTVATYLWGNWFGGLLKSSFSTDGQGEWGVAAAPAYNGTSSFNSGGDFIGILQSSKNKDAAWTFITWVTQNAESLKAMYQKNDLYPAWKPALSAAWMNGTDAYYAGQNPNSVFKPISAKMKPVTTNPADPIAAGAVTTALNNVLKKNMDIPSALKAAAQEIKSKM